VRSILTAEGFCEHPTKTKVMRRGRRQEVTGVVVNTVPNLAREDLRELRAILHNARKTGLSAQNREALPNFAAHVRGRIAYVSMVNPERGARLKRDFDALAAEGKG
jgi:RNA-directed DNA polymerase